MSRSPSIPPPTPVVAETTATTATLQRRADTLRAALKEFERTFAAQHKGQKPAKEDIKADAEIAAKYREYNKVRESIRTATASSTKTGTGKSEAKKRKVGVELEAETEKETGIATPKRKRGKLVQQQRRQQQQQEEEEQEKEDQDEEEQESFLPIGPTPQRDGTVLGIFDLMPNLPGSGSASNLYLMETPRKRRHNDGGYGITSIKDQVAATPSTRTTIAKTTEPEPGATTVATPQRSQRQRSNQGDLLQYLGSATPVTGGRAKHSRTPISEGRKFMLNQFFATPSAVRYQNIIHTGDTPPDTKERDVMNTPLKENKNEKSINGGDEAVGLVTPVAAAAAGVEEDENRAKDETPRYLKRTASFKERLLSASASCSLTSKPSELGGSPAATVDTGAAHITKSSNHMTKAKFQPKPLSQIAAEMLKQQSQSQTQNQTQNQNQTASHGEIDEDNIDDNDNEDDLEALRELEYAEMNSLLSADEDQQQKNHHHQEGVVYYKKKGSKRQTRRVVMKPQPRLGMKKSGDNNDNDSDSEHSDVLDDDDEHFEDDDDVTEGKIKKKTKTKSKDARETSKTYDPNAVSHMNFKSLKIKNKNSKGRAAAAGGGGGRGRGGRFGRTARAARHR